jgi:GR25 family glycosyltransferase involved in LPS biosynthesis
LKRESNLFQNAYIISIDKTSKRYLDTKAYTDAAGIVAQLWKGTVVKPEEKHTLPGQGIGTTHYTDRKGSVRNLGIIGCFLSHRALFNHIANDSNQSHKPGTLILEDDIVIPPTFYENLGAVEKEIPNDWDLIFFNKNPVSGIHVTRRIMKLDKDTTATMNFSTAMYIVKNASLKTKILPLLDSMTDNIDIQLNRHADTLNMYLTEPPFVQLGNAASVIESMEP